MVLKTYKNIKRKTSPFFYVVRLLINSCNIFYSFITNFKLKNEKYKVKIFCTN